LLSFTFAGSAFSAVECAKSDEIDDSKAAMVWVNVPGFMVSTAQSPQIFGAGPH
jgi:hypothetical protein